MLSHIPGLSICISVSFHSSSYMAFFFSFCVCRCVMEKGMFNKLLSLLQWAIFSSAALGMFAISLVRGLNLKDPTVLH